ncbi:MAG TPA: nucleoside transporter C-terminal domain-containing protein [Longimicrobiales bacterium]|nr:nucleoside transporter C-terminal domain-containing protein [Longimicrobiales bacterium]
MPRQAPPFRPVHILWAVAALFLLAGLASRMAPAAAQDPAPAVPVVDTAGASMQAADSARATGVGAAPDSALPLAGVQGRRLGETRSDVDVPFYQRLVSVLGLIAILLIAWALSVERRRVDWRILAWGLGLQLMFALFILKTPIGEAMFAALNDVIVALLGFTTDGARFLFGNLVDNAVPVRGAGEGAFAQTGAFFAFSVLPTIIFFSSLMTLLYHLGIMQAMVKGMAWVMMRTMRTSGAETLSAAGNIFVGQTEAPLMIKPFVERMTMSELNAVMTAGFATVAGGVMAAYVGLLVAHFPDIAGHLLAASVMSAPAALVVAKLMYPEREEPVTRSSLKVTVESPDANVIDAAARGASEGLTLALNVGAMLLAFIAIIALLNALIALVAGWTGLDGLLIATGALAPGQHLTLEAMLGWILAPLAWLMGVPWGDAVEVGSLLGIKTVANEFVAYLQLSAMLAGGADLSPRSIVIATYALAGFANFSSIAIQIGGIGGIAPSRRSDLSRLGLRAMIGGSLAAFLTATIAGILV